jgi:hypothetical protein
MLKALAVPNTAITPKTGRVERTSARLSPSRISAAAA